MDPITHAVIGMAAAKISGNALVLAEPVSAGIIIGSVFPDIDILLQKWGDCVYLKNHRGMTHSIPGLIISSLFIAGVLGIVYPGSNIIGIFLWTLAGCLSHVAFDLFNSYGVKLLWPLSEKKISLSLLTTFDPVVAGAFIGFIFTHGSIQNLFLYFLVIYLVLRILTRLFAARGLRKQFRVGCGRINILPSMTGFLRWHFVLETDSCNIVGEKYIFKREVKVIKKLYKLKGDALDKALYSPVGKFFREFTPLFHVASEKGEGITRYLFIDMRYFVRDKFLHHAVLEVDANDSVVKQTFNPYSMNRINKISA